MLRYSIALVALTLGCNAEGPPEVTCQDIGNIKLLDRTWTVSELEAFGLKQAKRDPAVPQLPFAYAHKQWAELEDKIQQGDTLRSFDNPEVPDDTRFGIPDGFVLMRGACVVAYMGLRIA